MSPNDGCPQTGVSDVPLLGIGQCVFSRMHPSDIASLRGCFPWTLRPWPICSKLGLHRNQNTAPPLESYLPTLSQIKVYLSRRVRTHSSGTSRLRDTSSKGCVDQGTRRPRDASPRVQKYQTERSWTCTLLGDTSSRHRENVLLDCILAKNRRSAKKFSKSTIRKFAE